MKNLFLEHPTEYDIKEIGDYFCLHDAVIVIDSTDVYEIMDGAENAIVLMGKSTGSNRCADAIEDAVLHTCNVAEGYGLFSADQVILYIISPKEKPMLMSENEAINTFIQMFSPITTWRWGLKESDETTELKVIIIATNLLKKIK